MNFRNSTLTAPLAACLVALPAAAQNGAAGSETSFSSARNAPTAGGAAASASFDVESEVAHATAGPVADSESYSFVGGAAWSDASFSASGPVVFGVADGRGDKDGGEPETVFGFGFQDPGAGATTVAIGGASASGVNVVSNTELSVTSGAGVNLYGNPLGRSEVTVANALGANTAADAYTYTPALAIDGEVRIGKNYRLDLYGEPGEFRASYYGLSIPGIALPIGGLDGAFDLLGLFLEAGPLAPAATDMTGWTLPVPFAPVLVGQSLDYQGYVLSSLAPLGGSFTNRLVVTFKN